MTESSLYKKAEELLLELNKEVLWLAQVNQDQKIEIQALRGELAHWKRQGRKYDLLYRIKKNMRKRPIDMHDMWPGDKEILEEIEK